MRTLSRSTLRRLAPLVSLAPLALLEASPTACGGTVELGALAESNTQPPGGADGGGGGEAGSAPGYVDPGTDTSCAATAAETLFDGRQTVGGAAYVRDFGGSSAHVYAAVNLVADAQAGRLLDLPSPGTGAEPLVNVSPKVVGNLGFAAGRVALVTIAGDAAGKGDRLALHEPSGAVAGGFDGIGRFATEPSRGDVVHAAPNGVVRWTPEAPAGATLLPAESGRGVVDLASIPGGGDAVVVLANTNDGEPGASRLVRTRGGGTASELAVFPSAEGRLVSNVAADATHVYVAWSGTRETRLFAIPLDPVTAAAIPLTASTATPIAILANGTTQARVEVDATDVYVAVNTETPRNGGCAVAAATPCALLPTRLGAVTKNAARTSPPAAPVEILSFTAPAIALSQHRAFALAGCHLVWSDGERLFRQPKGSFVR